MTALLENISSRGNGMIKAWCVLRSGDYGQSDLEEGGMELANRLRDR